MTWRSGYLLKIRPRNKQLSLSYEESEKLERLKHELAKELENVKGVAAQQPAFIAGGFSYAAGTLRSLLVVNGGAAIAILSLVSKLLELNAHEHSLLLQQALSRLTISFCLFAGGIATVLLSQGLSYVSQVFLTERSHRRNERRLKSGRILRPIAVVLALLSWTSFVAGASFAAACVAKYATVLGSTA